MPDQAVKRRIRVRKDDSAYIYSILESHEGIAAYSTLEFRPGDPHRDLELQVPVGFLTEVEEVLQRLRDAGYAVYDLE